MYIIKIILGTIFFLIGMICFPYPKEDWHKIHLELSCFILSVGGLMGILYNSWIALVMGVVTSFVIVSFADNNNKKLGQNKLIFVEINKKQDEYEYIFAIEAEKRNKKYLKYIFISEYPDYMWTEIQRAMIIRNIYFEDLIEGQFQDINIGSIAYSYFSKEDFDKYGSNYNKWSLLLNSVIDKQMKYIDDEDQNNPNRKLF